tara:strand:+ start:2938 stop:4995 length:2058 start_codon:yes stop_codon:yes gene_type:complete
VSDNKWKIGVDVGGTFTDFTLLNENTGELKFHKVPSTPEDPSQAIDRGLSELTKFYDVSAFEIEYFGHGTTVALNMLLERRAPTIGLLTTKGFRDVIEIGRQTRPHLYDYTLKRAPSLARRVDRKEITERITADGSILTPIDMEEVELAVKQLRTRSIKAVAICFLHAYLNPDHEILAGEVVRRLMPNAFISLSCEVLPEFREYERASTTVVNAYVGPKMQDYLVRLEKNLTRNNVITSPHIMHSNGGMLTVKTAAKLPVRTCLSGPAAGVVGAATIASSAGYNNILAFDVGGTSTDVSLVLDGQPLFTSERTVAGYPVKSPAIDVAAIGAGGGSIAWIDGGGALKVGPHSAGASPGPVAYGLGGEHVTLTDANLILGRLNPSTLLAGNIALDFKKAYVKMESQISNPLDLSVEAAATGIIKIASSGIARAIRGVASAKGNSPSEFSLFAYGGAGPLCAADVNEEVGCPRIIIPPAPGTLCARGILLSDLSFDFVRSVLVIAEEDGWEAVMNNLEVLKEQANKLFINDEVIPSARSFKYYLEARYKGQSYELRIPLPGQIKSNSLVEFIAAFHAEHKKEFGYELLERPIEIVNCRLEAVGKTSKPISEKATQNKTEPEVKETREVYFGSAFGWKETPVYERAGISHRSKVIGPAVIEEMSSTTILPPNYEATVDNRANLILVESS